MPGLFDHLPRMMGFPNERHVPEQDGSARHYRCFVNDWWVYVWGTSRQSTEPKWYAVVNREFLSLRQAVQTFHDKVERARAATTQQDELMLMAVIHHITRGGYDG